MGYKRERWQPDLHFGMQQKNKSWRSTVYFTATEHALKCERMPEQYLEFTSPILYAIQQ